MLLYRAKIANIQKLIVIKLWILQAYVQIYSFVGIKIIFRLNQVSFFAILDY